MKSEPQNSKPVESNESIVIPPVAFVIFNRPDKTARVFEVIRQVKPAQLFIIADAPRTEEERIRCDTARAITDHIDWPCEVKRNYATTNMGASGRITSGVSSAFEQVDRLIVLEDDCLPHPDFFRFCGELLEKYKDDTRVMHISGDNFQQKNGRFSCTESYYFSVMPQQQGWATWSRAWHLYDPTMSLWPAADTNGTLKTAFPDPAVREHWRYKFTQHHDAPDTLTWDGKWVFALVAHHAYAIMPRVNLISNIGYGADGTNTKYEDPEKGNLPVYSIGFPLVHPSVVAPNIQADAFEAKHYRGINRRLSQHVLFFFKLHLPTTYQLAKKILKPSPKNSNTV